MWLSSSNRSESSWLSRWKYSWLKLAYGTLKAWLFFNTTYKLTLFSYAIDLVGRCYQKDRIGSFVTRSVWWGLVCGDKAGMPSSFRWWTAQDYNSVRFACLDTGCRWSLKLVKWSRIKVFNLMWSCIKHTGMQEIHVPADMCTHRHVWRHDQRLKQALLWVRTITGWWRHWYRQIYVAST